MDYTSKPNFHYKPRKGWINDPNGLVCFNGYYHIFYQHSPNYEKPWHEPMHWGHARTRDFINWEELPVALYPDMPYDKGGCWSGTALVKDDTLFIAYTGHNEINGVFAETVNIAYSTDGISFTKYANNPVIAHYPEDGCPDFRDPALSHRNGKYYCVVASGNKEKQTANLLLYESPDIFNWKYIGVIYEWTGNKKFAECPSFILSKNEALLTASVCANDNNHFFSVMYGEFENNKFSPDITGLPDKGPDQYAGQVFHDTNGRNILITWVPGWAYENKFEQNIGCMSVPRELKCINGRIYAYPVEELHHLIKASDEAVKITDTGFIIERDSRSPVIHSGKVYEVAILRDEYILEVFVNNGEEVYTVLL